ncbi:MAG: FAD-dependent oxidoreductase [Peptoniphilaceae bacterium]|nr:FAD-dependent oxidoreductase [Peptoniphilaceae bacterium]
MQFFDTKIIKIVQETSDTWSFQLEIPENMTWTAGQHAIFRLPEAKLEEGDKPQRVFSVASAMEDGFIQFTTRIADPHSSYKENLLHAKVGDTVQMTQPTGSFTLHEDTERSVVIAGGIGITPIRSILRHWQHHNRPEHLITVYYSDDRGEFAYKEAFDEIQNAMDNLDFHYISDRNEFTEKVNSYAKEHQNEAEYLVAGSPGMNRAFSETLEKLGIEKDNIKLDNFVGY